MILSQENISAAAEQFNPGGKVAEIREYGSGNVNDTFLVSMESCETNSFILQRINTRVFRRPELVMRNMRVFTEHVARHLEAHPVTGRRWETVRILAAKDSPDHWIDPRNCFWRAISFIDAAQSFDRIKDINHAREIGYALGLFHKLVSDLPPEHLSDTLEGFHITPLYLRPYDAVIDSGSSKSAGVAACSRFVESHRSIAGVLEEARQSGRLPVRTIHGDPKVNNVMIDKQTGQAVSVIDLDTVKPGLIHYDIGDCLRSCCNKLGEETLAHQEVRFDLDLCRAILDGYFEVARDFLTEDDYFYIYDAIRLIAFELGLRFFTDYLEGDVYFKVKYREHNLARALVQFQLTGSVEAQEEAIRAIIRDAR